MILYQILRLLIFLQFTSGDEFRMSLNSDSIPGSWTLRNTAFGISVPGKVPGGVYSDLEAAGILENVLYGVNDREYRWIGHRLWTYKAEFQVPLEVKKKVINLVFHGVDTVAIGTFNKFELPPFVNMFVRYVVPITDHLLVNDTNFLEMTFLSTTQMANYTANEAEYMVPPECPPKIQAGECHINFLRKMQSSFAWQGGPSFPSVGLWKAVEIEAYDYAIVRDLIILTLKSDSDWIIKATVHVESSSLVNGFVPYLYIRPYHKSGKMGKIVAQTATYVANGAKSFSVDLSINVNEEYVNAWWPNGYGEQSLYKATVILNSIDDLGESHTSSRSVTFGFRTVELVQEAYTRGEEEGSNFFFKVNGIPVFAKGANWVPSHVLPELGYEKQVIEHLMHSAKKANMNMLRVWGGGVYESDGFYELADRLGIMVWQDFMFSSALYPADPDFISNVRTEVEYQVARLGSHPSIVIWAGNNKIESALNEDWFSMKRRLGARYRRYFSDYETLFIKNIQPLVQRLDPSRPFVLSVPSVGVQVDREALVQGTPKKQSQILVNHYYYKRNAWDPSTYPSATFAIEYGLQSLPSASTLLNASKPEDLRLDSKFMKRRQHHQYAYQQMKYTMKRYLPWLRDDRTIFSFEKYIYYTQIGQAMSIKQQTEKYRRDMGDTTMKRTMGALYWQLNDLWQAPSWSSIEWGGKWKMLHYFAVKFFASVLVSPVFSENDDLDVYIVNDLPYDIPRAFIVVTMHSWDSLTPVKEMSTCVTVRRSESASYLRLTNLSEEFGYHSSRHFIYVSLLGKTAQGDIVAEENFVFKGGLTETEIPQPNINITKGGTWNEQEVSVRIQTDTISPFFWLEVDISGHFSDNGFILRQAEKEVKFSNWGKPIDSEKFMDTLKYRSLVNEI